MVDRNKVAQKIVARNAKKRGMVKSKRIFKKHGMKVPRKNVYESK